MLCLSPDNNISTLVNVNAPVVATTFFSTGGGVKGKKIYTC